jgi:hypothetical protein
VRDYYYVVGVLTADSERVVCTHAGSDTVLVPVNNQKGNDDEKAEEKEPSQQGH